MASPSTSESSFQLDLVDSRTFSSAIDTCSHPYDSTQSVTTVTRSESLSRLLDI